MKYHWPKEPAKLSREQEEAREAWMKHWHEVLPSKFQMIEKFNHGYPVSRTSKEKKIRTLEVGAGLGGHVAWEDLSHQEYHMLEYREDWCQILREKNPDLQVVFGDIQKQLPYPDGYFDRIIAIHVLEHLPNLPEALKEIKRLLKPEGRFQVVIPCEGGLAYGFARKISSDRMFRKKFKMPYMPIILAEHVNTLPEIIKCVEDTGFKFSDKEYFPLKIPVWFMNVCQGFELQK